MNLFDDLGPRETEILRLVIRGMTNRAIATQLVLSIPTIQTHLVHIYRKLDVQSRAGATAYALLHGLKVG